MKWIITLVIYLFLVSNVIGQELNREVYPKPVTSEYNQAIKEFGSDLISSQQSPADYRISDLSTLGIKNIAGIRLNGIENISLITQEGMNLTGLIHIRGDYNRSSLTQKGTDLLSMLNIQGNDNQFNLLQEGSGLQNYIQVLGSGMNLNAIQTNRGFKINQGGLNSIPFEIEHQGGMLPLRIETNVNH
jgi:hypothetical protein